MVRPRLLREECWYYKIGLTLWLRQNKLACYCEQNRDQISVVCNIMHQVVLSCLVPIQIPEVLPLVE